MAQTTPTQFRHVTIDRANHCDDQTIIRFLERAFETSFPNSFTEFILAANGGFLEYKYVHPELPESENEFFIQRILSIGKHKLNSPNDVLVYTDHQHLNEQLIPRQVIAFALDAREWPIFIDLTDSTDGRIVVHDDLESLSAPDWIRRPIAHEFRYICDSFDEYINNLVPILLPPDRPWTIRHITKNK